MCSPWLKPAEGASESAVPSLPEAVRASSCRALVCMPVLRSKCSDNLMNYVSIPARSSLKEGGPASQMNSYRWLPTLTDGPSTLDGAVRHCCCGMM